MSRSPTVGDSTDAEVSLTISSEEGQSRGYCSRVVLKAYDSTIDVSSDSRRRITGYSIDSIDLYRDLFESGKQDKLLLIPQDLIPCPVAIERTHRVGHGTLVERRYWSEFSTSLLDNRVGRNTRAKLQDKLLSIPACGIRQYRTALKRLSYLVTYQDKLTSALRWRSGWVKRMHALHLAVHAEELFSYVDSTVSPWARSVSYIAPFRAVARRYYRLQDLQVDQLDPSGSNLAMFLNSLSHRELHSFNEFIDSQFNIRVEPNREGGHVALNVASQNEDGSKSKDNIVDTGFGITQLLPVLAQLWAAAHSSKNRRRRGLRSALTTSLAIEQPELHLHPAHQSRLGAALADALANNSLQPHLQMSIETHSQYLINAIGESIRATDLDRNSIVIYRVENLPGQPFSHVERSEFEQDGTLSNWPFGFFTG